PATGPSAAAADAARPPDLPCPAPPVSASERGMKKAIEKLQGTWEVVSLEIEGRPMGESGFRGSRIVVKGDTFATCSMGATYRGTLRVDAAKKPGALDLLFEEGPEKGNRSLGIFELDGDTWKICLTVHGDTRPRAFETRPGSGLALETLK